MRKGEGRKVSQGQKQTDALAQDCTHARAGGCVHVRLHTHITATHLSAAFLREKEELCRQSLLGQSSRLISAIIRLSFLNRAYKKKDDSLKTKGLGGNSLAGLR